MQSSDKPNKFNIPFANGGSKRTIPQASQIGITDGAASLTDGFPPLTFTPVSAGGKGPSGLDFNGLLNQMTAADRWAMAGGGYAWDSAFSTAIGGYPKGARVLKSDGSGYWQSTTENNITNPDTGGAGWVSDFTNKTITAGKVLGRDTSGNGVVQELPIAVDSSGNVGIGTSSPANILSIYRGAGASTLIDLTANGNTAGISNVVVGQNSDDGGYFWNRKSSFLSFGTGNTERARIDSSGNFKHDSGYGSVQTAYGCRAWGLINGVSGAVIGGGGITSAAHPSTGVITVTLSFTMPDTNYVVNPSYTQNGSGQYINDISISNKTTTSFQIATAFVTGSADDVRQMKDASQVGFTVTR